MENLDLELTNDIQQMTARMFGFREIRVHDYRADVAFRKWYWETTGMDFDDEEDINDAIDCFLQQQWCAENCDPTTDTKAVFHCRPQSGTFKDFLDDPEGHILGFVDGKFQQVKCQHLLEYEQALEKERRARLLRRANIPALFKDVAFDNYVPQDETQKRALAMARRVAQEKKGLFLCGNVGVGKTHLAIAILKYNLERGVDGLFIRAVDFLNSLRPPNNDYALLERARETGLLVFDDLGLQSDTTWTFEKITDVIDYRVANMLPLVITSNLLLEMMSDQNLEYQRIVSRIEQGCEIVLLKGEDYRRKIALERKWGRQNVNIQKESGKVE